MEMLPCDIIFIIGQKLDAHEYLQFSEVSKLIRRSLKEKYSNYFYKQGEILKIIFQAVLLDPFFIKNCQNIPEKIQLAAVVQIPYTIRYIKNPSIDVQLAAVRKNGHAIGYIEDPSEEIQIVAVKENGYCIQWIKNPSEKVKNACGFNM